MKNRLTKHIAAAMFAAALILISGTIASAQRPTRIYFGRSATTAVVTGSLSGFNDAKIYVIKVRAGQTLRTEQIGANHNITIYLTNPRGEDANDSDASCNNRREVMPTEVGDYQIKVVECQKADRWRGTFKFRVSVH